MPIFSQNVQCLSLLVQIELKCTVCPVQIELKLAVVADDH